MSKNKNIFIVGGDGFCGWPLSLRLSKNNWNVIILDNLLRRKIDKKLKANSITPIKSINNRIKTWKKLTKKEIKYYNVDIVNQPKQVTSLVKKYKPKSIVMLAELKSAPYSMISLKHANLNISHNLIANNNFLHSINKYSKNTHYIHLGTMGVYGYDLSKKLLPDGYYLATIKNQLNQTQKVEILHPAMPGSIYHLTKAQDELLFQFYNKLYNLKITDLHQGIVWGFETEETKLHNNLINRFDYDGIYGTYINRLIAQSVINHPLTVHGSGNQLRPFINLKNSVDCIELAIKNPPAAKSKVEIYNQITQVKKLINIAEIISKISGSKIDHQSNPRIENENNNLKVEATKFINLGLKNVIKINKINIADTIKKIKKIKKNINAKCIKSKIKW